MIKIERSTAVKPTILRNGVRQPVTLNMIVTQAELDSLEAQTGEILYTVDETEIKTVVFAASKHPSPPPVAEPVAVAISDTVVAAPVAKPVIQPARKTAKVAQA